jgi:hypothetical protein
VLKESQINSENQTPEGNNIRVPLQWTQMNIDHLFLLIQRSRITNDILEL